MQRSGNEAGADEKQCTLPGLTKVTFPVLVEMNS